MENENLRSIPNIPGYYISKSGEIYNFTKSTDVKPLKHQIVGGNPRITLPNINGNRTSLKVAKLVLESFGKTRPSQKYIIHYKDHNRNNVKLDNLEWILPIQKDLSNEDLDIIIISENSCFKCKKYPCMERQKNGLTKFDFGKSGCVEYKPKE